MAEVDLVLLNDVKADQGVTWSDSLTDQQFANRIALGMAYLDGKLGVPGDYSAPGTPRMLLFEYVRYARAGALDVFENNYLSMILSMQDERRLKAYAESSVSSG